MSIESVGRKFESKLVDGPKASVIKAAYEQDVVWINVASIYGFSDTEQPALRSYIRKTYHSNAKLIARQVVPD